jgi:hypothetical protein
MRLISGSSAAEYAGGMGDGTAVSAVISGGASRAPPEPGFAAGVVGGLFAAFCWPAHPARRMARTSSAEITMPTAGNRVIISHLISKKIF